MNEILGHRVIKVVLYQMAHNNFSLYTQIYYNILDGRQKWIKTSVKLSSNFLSASESESA